MSSGADPAASGPADERAAALGAALARRGIGVRVESAGALAILVPAGEAPIDWPALRRDAVRLATELGFTHVALEPHPERTDG